MSGGDTSLDEKRVYGEKTAATEVYVASDLGVTLVSVSADIVGEFTLAHRCAARDLAAGSDALAVATDDDVLVTEGSSFEGTEFGTAVAVGFDGDALVAAGPAGTVAGRTDDGTWQELGSVESARAIDGDLVAAADGVHRIDEEGLSHVGLSDVRDVATGGSPLAATGDGLYALGPGWAQVREGAFETVDSAGDGGLAHAVADDGTLLVRSGPDGGSKWQARSVPAAGTVAALAYGEGVYAVTDGGTVLVDAGDGWRSRALGLDGVTGLAVVPAT